MYKISSLSNDQIKFVQSLCYKNYGITVSSDRVSKICHVLNTRMALFNLKQVNDYLELLNRDCDEKKEFLNSFTVGETYFYRNQAHMDIIKNDVFNHLLNDWLYKRTDKIKIWSAACATGEEPYTLSILAKEFGWGGHGCNVEIVASDINEGFINKAKRGLYSTRRVASVPEDALSNYFKYVESEDSYQLSKEILNSVEFNKVNLIEPPYFKKPGNFNLIVCRNVLIYFDMKTIGQVLNGLVSNLAPGGFLVLGHSESLYYYKHDLDLLEFNGVFIYQKPSKESSVNLNSMPVEEQDSIRMKALDAYENKMYKEALELFDKSLVESPNDVEVLMAKANILARSNLHDLSLNELDKIFAIDDLHTEAYYLQGMLYLQKKDLKQATLSFQKLIYLDQECIAGHYQLAKVYIEQSDFERASRVYSRFQSLVQEMDAYEIIPFTEGVTASVFQQLAEALLGGIDESISC
jgi:chemotaxis protein methyltransferase CheR